MTPKAHEAAKMLRSNLHIGYLAQAPIPIREAVRLLVDNVLGGTAVCFECEPSRLVTMVTPPLPPPTCTKCGKPCVGGCWMDPATPASGDPHAVEFAIDVILKSPDAMAKIAARIFEKLGQ